MLPGILAKKVDFTVVRKHKWYDDIWGKYEIEPEIEEAGMVCIYLIRNTFRSKTNGDKHASLLAM